MDFSWLILISVFLFGVIVGSFLNAWSFRIGTKLSVLKGKSRCMACEKELSWFELVPVFSFLLQKARCRGCGEGISWQYPLIEVLTGVTFLAVFWKVGALEAFSAGEVLNLQTLFLVIYLAIWSILIVILIYDFRHKIIPDGLSYSFAGLALVVFLAEHISQGLALDNVFWWDLAAGPILFVPFFLLWYLSSGRLMGLGDGKLAVGMGFLLGLWGGVSAVVFAFWIGAVVSVSIIFIDRALQTLGLKESGGQMNLKSEIPFGPFLIFGTALVFFTGIDIWGISNFFVL